MNFLTALISLVISCFFLSGCIATKESQEAKENRAFFENNGYFTELDKNSEQEILALIEDLTSSDFFVHTKAARKLIEKGKEAIPVLYANRNKKREVNGRLIAVCPCLIRMILEEERKNKPTSSTTSPNLSSANAKQKKNIQAR